MKKNSQKNLITIVAPLLFGIGVLFAVWSGYRTFSKRTQPAFLQPLQNSPSVSSEPATITPFANISKSDIKIPSSEIDSDSDGLSDAMEILYKTDPQNADTDLDTYKDGDEVANGYDPLIKSPNDKVGVAHGSPSPTPPTLTQQFVNKTGTNLQELTTNEEAVNKFINETNARGILPIITDNDIKIINTSGKAAIVKYLDSLSTKKNKKIKPVTPEQISSAFTNYTQTNNPAQIDAVISDLKNNAAIFSGVEVPKEAVELHKKYLAAVLALRDNTIQLKNYKTDYMSALVAGSRLDGLKTIFSEIETDIKNLEKKYNIT